MASSIDSSCDRRARTRVGRRGVVLTAIVGLALATATPGFAADDLVPIAEIASPPEVATGAPPSVPGPSALPPPPEAETAPPAEPPITISVDAEGGDIDVSVRVLSPGDDGSDAAEPPVVSGSEAPDITPPSSEQPDRPAGEPVQGSNTNVTVRILSPGDDGPVDQGSSLGPASAASPSVENRASKVLGEGETSGEVARDAAPEASPGPNGDAQYQDQDLRYQSTDPFSEEPWVWNWDLSVDCAGEALSTSTETGRQSSREWEWTWEWDWACGSPPHPPPVDSLEAAVDDEPTRSSAEPQGAAPTSAESKAEPTSGEVGAAPSWLWTWTFTFCGETVTATLPIDPETALRWIWDWTWTWSCQPATTPESSEPTGSHATGDPHSVSSTGVSGGSGGETEGGDGTSAGEHDVEPLLPWIVRVEIPAWVISLLPPELGGAVVPAIEPLLPGASISTFVDIAPPLVVPAIPVVADAAAPFEPTVISPRPRQGGHAATAAATLPATAGTSSWGRSEPRSAEPRVEKASAPAKQHATGRRSGGIPVSPWPPLRPFQAAGAPGASSGFAPSGSVVGTAALVALFILAAPGLGRRLRAARQLRPRGTYGSSIDHPG